MPFIQLLSLTKAMFLSLSCIMVCNGKRLTCGSHSEMRRTIKSREQWSTCTLTPAFALFPSVEIHPPQNPWSFLRTPPPLFLSINSGVNFSQCDCASVSRSFSSEQMGAVNFCGLHAACVRVKCLRVPVFCYCAMANESSRCPFGLAVWSVWLCDSLSYRQSSQTPHQRNMF